MNALLPLALFEIRYNGRQPATALFALLLFGQGIWLGLADNGPTNLYILLTGLGPMVMLVASVLAGQALTKDLEYKTASYLYALPVSDTGWFTGKFIGTYLTVLVLTLFFPAGVATAGYVQGMPVPLSELADGFVKIMMQNVLMVVSAGYALTVFTRRMAGAYLAMFGLGLYAFLAQSYRDVVAVNDLLKLLDPFGMGIVTEAVDRAGGSAPDLSDTWLISRLLWLGLTFGLLSRAETRFSFSWFAARPAEKPPKPERPVQPVSPAYSLPIPVVGRPDQIRVLTHLTRLTFVELTQQTAFRLSLLALVLATVGYAFFYGQPDYLAEPLLPTTARMTGLRQPIGLFIGLFLLVWTGELVFRERTTGSWMMYDTLPQPTYLTALAKLLTMMGVAILLTLPLFGVGLGRQLANGQTPIEEALYAGDLLIDGLFRYWQLVALGLFVSVLTGNRFVAHTVSAGLLLFFTFAPQLTWFGNPAWRYSFLPGSDQYSDLSGYGRFALIRPIFHGLWWGVAACLLMLAIRNWPRGVTRPLSERLALWTSGVRRPYKLALMATVCWVAGCGYLIGRAGYATESFSRTGRSPGSPVVYTIQTSRVTLANGRQLPVRMAFYHPYNVDLFQQGLRAGLHYGEQIFGPFPYAELNLTETPAPGNEISSTPGQLRMAEPYGWTAIRAVGRPHPGGPHPGRPHSGWPSSRRGTATTGDVSYIYYLTVREVLKQWIPNGLTVADTAGAAFLRNGLADYLAAQALQQRYGAEKLATQINQYKTAVFRGQSRATAAQRPVLYADADYSARDEAALMLCRIGQAWHDDSLRNTIGRFYRLAITRPTPATATDFNRQLSRDLPDSLRYLTQYLENRYQFNLGIGQISQLPQGLFADVVCEKWADDGAVPSAPKRPLVMADYIPVVLRDGSGAEQYRTRVLLGSGHQNNPVRLPILPGSAEVVVDPLGVWSDNPSDNHKRLAQRR